MNKHSICFILKSKALGMLLAAFSMFSFAACDDELEPTLGYPTEIQNVELGVAAMIADPDNPVIDIFSDPRITRITYCRTNMNNPLALTQGMPA